MASLTFGLGTVGVRYYCDFHYKAPRVLDMPRVKSWKRSLTKQGEFDPCNALQLTDTSELSVSERIGEHANNSFLRRQWPAEYVLDGFGLGKQWLYVVGPLEQRIKAQFEQWLMKNSMQQRQC